MNRQRNVALCLALCAAALFSGCGPDVEFSADKTGGPRPLTVKFTDNSASRLPGRINVNSILPVFGWQWDFGDGGGSNDRNPSHVYQVSGVYSVSLTVSNSLGSTTETRENLINVGLPTTEPTAAFTFVVDSTDLLTVQFTDTSAAGSRDIEEWIWDFGDGNESTEQNPSHTYDEPGDYTVELEVRTAAGNDAVESDVRLRLPPNANFSFAADGAEGFNIQFTDTSDGGGANISDWAWDFGLNGTDDTASVQNPEFDYTDAGAGNYQVMLTITTNEGQDTVTRTVRVPVSK